MSQAQDFVASVKAFGTNIERTNAINYGFSKSVAPWNALAADGAGGIGRLFVPFSPTGNFGMPGGTSIPKAADIAPYLDAAGYAVLAGVPVCTEFLDVSNLSEWGTARSAMMDYLAMCASEAAKRNLDPKMVTFGPCNEWASQTNPAWQSIINDTAGIFADALPNHVIVVNGGGWGGVANYGTDSPLQLPLKLPAGRALWQCHDYDTGSENASHWSSVAAIMDAFVARFPGSAWRFGEAGFGGVNADASYNAARWSRVVAAVAAGAPRSAPTFWCMTNGAAWPMNPQGVGTLQPGLVAAFKAAAVVVAGTAPPPVASVITVSDPGTIQADAAGHAAFTASLKTNPALGKMEIVAVEGADPWSFYDDATGLTTIQLKAGGGVYQVAFNNTGDFLKFGPVGGPYKDGQPVTITAATPVPPPGVTAAQIAAIVAVLAELSALMEALKPAS